MKKPRQTKASATSDRNATTSSERDAHCSDSPQSVQAQWDAYWFSPQSATSLISIHRVVCIVAIVWFLVQINAHDFWWGQFGLSDSAFSGRLEGFTEGEFVAQFRWSPLWMTQSFVVMTMWCIAGVCLGILGFFNLGGRWLRIVLAIWILFLTQRLTWANGLVEPYLVAMAGYLSMARLSPSEDWSHGFSKRLIQVHTWLLLCTALISQLAISTWWQGEAVWWLAASGRSTLLSTTWLEGRPLLVNLVTHAITLCTVLSVGCLWPFARSTSQLRYRCGMLAVLGVAVAYALVADHVLYGCLLASSTLAWRPMECGSAATAFVRLTV